MKTKNSGVVLLLGAMSFAASMTVMAGSIESDPIDSHAIYLAANAVSDQVTGAAPVNKLGVCHAINGLDDIFPTSDAARYFANIKHQNFVFDYYPDGSVRKDISIRILEQPKHGKLVQNEPEAEDIGKYSYKYIPDENYSGYDKFVMEASAGGNIVQIYYMMSVSLPGEPTYTLDDNGNKVDDLSRCPRPYWKISAILNSGGTNTITSVEYQSPTTSTNQWGQTRLIHKSNWEDGYSQTPPHGHGDRKSEKFVNNRT